MGPEKIEEGAGNSNHLLDTMHTHIGIGVYAAGNKLRYVEVCWDVTPHWRNRSAKHRGLSRAVF